jgi:hypothetical protein
MISGRESKTCYLGERAMWEPRKTDNRLLVEALLYHYRAGIPWRDLPSWFGDFRVIHTRWASMVKNRRVGAGVWAPKQMMPTTNMRWLIRAIAVPLNTAQVQRGEVSTEAIGRSCRRIKYQDSCCGGGAGQLTQFPLDTWASLRPWWSRPAVTQHCCWYSISRQRLWCWWASNWEASGAG